jgi:hypothetical protein
MESSFAYENLSERELAETLDRLNQELAAGQAQIYGRRMQQRAAISQLKGMRGALSDLAWELEELEHHLRDLQAQREGPIDPLAEREIASIRGRRAALEERLLAHMLQVDELAATTAAEEQALAIASDEWLARKTALLAEREQVVASLSRRAKAGE